MTQRGFLVGYDSLEVFDFQLNPTNITDGKASNFAAVVTPAGSQPQFQWIAGDDAAHSVIAFLRWDRDRAQPVAVVSNFLSTPHSAYRIGVPLPGRYREILNSDSGHYGGSNLGNAGVLEAEAHPYHGFPNSLELTLPPLATLWLVPEGAAP